MSRSRFLAPYTMSVFLSVYSGFAQQTQSGNKDTTIPKNKVIATVAVGQDPSGIVVSPDSSTIYVANLQSNSVTVIDANNNYAVKATITGLDFPVDLAINQAGTILYVTNGSFPGGSVPGIVSVIDTTQANYPITASITIGSFPQGLALSPDGKTLYVANRGDFGQAVSEASVSAIDTATNQVIATLDTPGNPCSVLFTDAGRQADVLSLGGTGFLQFIDTTTKAFLPFLGGEQIVYSPAGMIADRGGATLYIANYENYVLVVRPDNGAVTKEILAAPDPFTLVRLGQPALTPDGRYLYVPYIVNLTTFTGNVVVMIDVRSGQIVGTPITVGNVPFWAQIAPNGRTLYVDSNPANNVTVIDITPQ